MVALNWILLLPLLAEDAGVREHKDIPYYEGKDAHPRKHKLDLYLPKSNGPVPGIRNHITIVTSMALHENDPVRLKISEWIKSR